MINKNLDKISVIVPAYNVENYISECLDSLINQTYKNLEIILIDDGSTDNTYKICKKYSENYDNIKLFHQKNSGVCAARNKGLENATGKYISFIDSDDYLTLDAYETMIKNIKSYDMLTYNWKQVFKNNTKSCGITKNSHLDRKHAVLKCINSYDSYQGYLWNKLFLYKIINDNNLKFDESISICEDLLFCINYIVNCNNIKCITQILYNYRFRKSSVSKKFDLNKFCTILNSYDKIIPILNNVEPDFTNIILCDYLLIYYQYKKIFIKNNTIPNINVKDSYKCVMKSKLVLKSKKIELFNRKKFSILTRIYYKVINTCRNKQEMFE